MLDFLFTSESSADVASKTNAVLNELVVEIRRELENCEFGDGVSQVSVGVIGVSDDLISAGYFLERKPRLHRERMTIKKVDGSEEVFERCLTWDISLNHSGALLASNVELRRSVLKALQSSVMKLKKYASFDVPQFQERFANVR